MTLLLAFHERSCSVSKINKEQLVQCTAVSVKESVAGKMFSRRIGRGFSLVKNSPSRNITSAAVQGHLGANKQEEDAKLAGGELVYEAAKPLNSMPGPSFWKFTWDIIKDPGLKLKIDQLCRG